MTTPETPEEHAGNTESKPAGVHHSVWSFSREQPRQAIGTGTGWASAFFPPVALQAAGALDPAGAAVPPPSPNGSSTFEGVVSALEHKIATLQQDLAHSWGHLNDWKKRLAYEQSEITLRCQDLDNREKMLSQLAAELHERDEHVSQRQQEISRLDDDLEARLRELGHAEVLSMARDLEEREHEVQRFAEQYDGKRAELEALKQAAEEQRHSAEHELEAAETMRRQIEQHTGQIVEREQQLDIERAKLEGLRGQLHEHQQHLLRREQGLEERQARMEHISKQLEARWHELSKNEESLKKRQEALQRFAHELQQTMQAWEGHARRDVLSTPPRPGAVQRPDVDDMFRSLQHEAETLIQDFSAGDQPCDARGSLDAHEAGGPATEDQVRQADSLNTHLFRRIRHSRTQGREGARPAAEDTRDAWWDQADRFE